MTPITYELAKERMADRLRDADQRRLVQQAKAAAREGRAGLGQGIDLRGRLASWRRLRGSGARVPNTSIASRTV